ncbi:hypothetical protein BpHYR1_039300 [Brachionus plicatilis]|uniref:Uncharacterized protein n=1 Tax=Brachionus plicatilis TaxID=10195 RepID=A0A3M7QDW9_BRAPC|nr:hypothetical protein BpHYR1_039300 [Brachionus plicatilis]
MEIITIQKKIRHYFIKIPSLILLNTKIKEMVKIKQLLSQDASEALRFRCIIIAVVRWNTEESEVNMSTIRIDINI